MILDIAVGVFLAGLALFMLPVILVSPVIIFGIIMDILGIK
jgi:hypothetical protein